MSSMEILNVITSMLGGLALFLFGMETLSGSLTKMTGGALKGFIGAITKNRFTAFVFGAVLTAIVQSSSAITVLSVGLVNSGIIELSKASGLLIGANLGTTATAWVLSLNGIDGESLIMTLIKPSTFSPFLAIIGVALMMFAKADKKKNIGTVLLGFSVMMIGMNLMSQGVAPLKAIPAVQNMLVSFSNPVLGFLFACVFALIIQSSDAVIGIVQAFALSMGITYGMAFPLICGAQVGTCITALMSSLGASNNGKRTAVMNLYYNLLKTIPVMLVFYLLNYLIGFSGLEKEVGAIGIPAVHTMVNIIGCLIWLPCSKVIVALANKTIPLSEEEKMEKANVLTMLDESFLQDVSFAIEQSDTAVKQLLNTVGDAFNSIVEKDLEKFNQVPVLCERAEKYKEQIDAYLSKLSGETMENNERASVNMLIRVSTALGRSTNIARRLHNVYVSYRESDGQIREDDIRELKVVGKSIYEVMQLTYLEYEKRTVTIAETILFYREEITALSAIAKQHYVQRAHENSGSGYDDSLYTDVCYIQEQMLDYCDMIADSLIRYAKETGTYKEISEQDRNQKRQQIHEIFADKYEELS